MNCQLCNRTIKQYDPAFHQLRIDDSHTVALCSECSHKVVVWQGVVLSKLFPTKMLKKRFSGKT